MLELLEEEVEVVDEVLVAASVKRIPPLKNWVLLLGVKVTVEAMVDTVGKKRGIQLHIEMLSCYPIKYSLHMTFVLQLTIE